MRARYKQPRCHVSGLWEPDAAEVRAVHGSEPDGEPHHYDRSHREKYKALQFAGAAAIALAVASCAAAVPSSGSWSGFVFLIGIALYTCGRIGAWWKHG
jgi:hypothetical protein